jgi:hypothetical protein
LVASLFLRTFSFLVASNLRRCAVLCWAESLARSLIPYHVGVLG